MTTLAITPNWKNKTAKLKGTVAAGEHVSVTIQNDNGEGEKVIDDASTLRLRVVGMDGRTLAIFPEPVPEGETPETWGEEDLTPLTCTLNLNTVQMLKAVPPAANVPLLWVLDDYDNKTLYFKERFEVTHWPRLRGEEEPTDLDNYKDIIADFNTRLDGYDSRITGAENAAQAATENASAAAATANQAVGIANQALDKAETAQNSAAASAEAAAVAQVAAKAAQVAAEEAAESINSPDATLSEEGVAADAKAAGDAIAAEEARATAAEAAEETRAKGVESGLRTGLTAAQKAIDDEAVLRAAADADLDANKADKATTYTKTEVDTKIAGVQTFGKAVVQTLPDLADADDKTIYLVPRADSEAPDLCDEYVVVEEDGVWRWERIGAKAVDLTLDNTVTRTSANGVKSSGIWSAIWGALTALPTGFSSLYDWCVAQLAGKQPLFTVSAISGTIIKTILTFAKDGSLMKPIEIPTSGMTVNGKALSSDVTLTGADIAVSDTDETKISAALAGKAAASAIPYTLADPIVVATAQSEVVEGETIYYSSETLEDRTANIIQVTAATPLDELRITFPSATSGKVRDFGLRVEIGTGSAALTAPALVPIAPPAETIKIENADGTIPALADGTATAKGVTLLYFSETAPGVFVVKGEQVEEVA